MGNFPKAVRRIAFARANGQCEDCGRKFSEGWQLDCHHKLPHSFGGEDTLDNAVMLCLECHAKRHRALGMHRAVQSIKSRMRMSGGGRTEEWLRKNGGVK